MNRLAFIIAAGITVAVAVIGVAANDPYDGILRGLLEGGTFLGGYAILGRYLAIRRDDPSHARSDRPAEEGGVDAR